MESMDPDSDDPDYHTVCAALEEVKLAFLKPFFKKHCLEDETLNLMKSEEELKNVLMENLGLPFGQAFKFSRNWFEKYHKYKENREKSAKLALDKDDISEVQNGNRNLSIKTLMMKEGVVIQDRPSNDTEKPVTSQWLKSKQHAGEQKACENTKTDALFEVFKEGTNQHQNTTYDTALYVMCGNEEQSAKEDVKNLFRTASSSMEIEDNPDQLPTTEEPDQDFVNQETKRPLEDEKNSKKGKPTLKIEEKGENMLDSKKDGIYIHCHPNGITGGIPENHQLNDVVCDSQDSVNRFKGQESQKAHSKDSSRISLEHKLPTEEENCFSTPEESKLEKIETTTRTQSADKLSPRIEKGAGELSLCTNYADTAIVTFSSAPVDSNSTMPQIDDLPPIQQHGETTETTNADEIAAVRSEEMAQKCKRRKFGAKVEEDFFYQQGSVLDGHEDREVEFKSLAGASPGSLRWKVMEKAKKFICGCLNADRKGIIYFGVGDSQEQGSKFQHGEIIGLDVENVKDDINKAFQDVLDHHIKSDDRPLQKGGEQNCINIYFIPVKSTQNAIDLYVIEIEVARNFLYCKENVYYYKVWSEKSESRDCTGKTGLRDFFKVKDEFVEAAIRTNGASCCVKPNEVKWQIRDPLSKRYKEWKRDVKCGVSGLTSDGLITNDGDLQKFSTIVRERLRDLNFQEYHYILVANKLPPEYRGTSKLSFLQNIPWVAVFDLFDAASKKDGLYFSCNEVGDGARANVKTLHDFKDVSPSSIGDRDCPLSLRWTTWILKQPDRMEEEDWITCSKDCLYRTLTAYKQSFPSGRLIFVFLGFAENAVLEMSDIAESCFSILGEEIASKSVTIISENKLVADAFIKASRSPLVRKQLRECSITGISWDLLKEIVKGMVGPLEFQERGATTKLPHITGLKDILNKVINSWVDLEVYYPEPQDRLPRLTQDIEKVRDAFYKGGQCNQVNLFYDHSIERTLEEEITRKIDQALKSLSEARGDRSCYVKTVTVPYEPGSGATTLCRRILWKKRKVFRCAVVKAITASTEFQIRELQSKGYEKMKSNYAPPALVLIDNFPQIDTQRLSKGLTSMETKCVILSTVPIEKSGTDLYFDITPLKQLDETETQLVKNILINITKDTEKRKKGEEVLEREKRFIWFGLELFGRDYVKIEERLQNHISSTLAILGSSHSIHEKLLNFCCFLHFYSRSRYILPHPLVVDLLIKESNNGEEEHQRKDLIHDLFGGLLLEGFDETHGYSGWQPAHYLVSEVVKSRMNVEVIALLLLENAEGGMAYVKFLRKQLFQIFLSRKRISEPVYLSQKGGTDDDIIGSDIETDLFGFYEVRTRYSPLILDIQGQDDGNRRTLEFLIATCQKANQTEYKAYAWQQLARFMGYEMRSEELERTDTLHERLYSVMEESKVGDIRLPRPNTGIEAAHIAVEIAINQQPSYSHHYTTKGVLYVLQLRDYNDQDDVNPMSHLPDVINICRKALEVYDQAIKMMLSLNYYSMIGKIQVIVLLLKIVKGLPCFFLDSSLFSSYLENGEIPEEMKEVLLPGDHNYVQSLSRTTLDLLNKLFGDVKYRQLTSYDENEMSGISSARIRACKLRRQFYEITGFDRSELVDVELPLSPVLKDAPDLLPQIVQDTLFKRRETSYSGWSNLDDEVVSSIYRLLKPVCLKDHGNHDDMVIFSRACLRLRSEEKPPVKELDDVVQNWVQRFPGSQWAHLFNCMIHFPIPNGSLAPYDSKTLASVKECRRIAQERTNWKVRHSGAEYFLGKGKGLSAIVSSQRFPTLEKKSKTKTHFWRSKEVSDVLLRVRGQKEAKGIIIYHGIKLRFDDMLYPKPSRDNLWFYVGFSVTGPYAFDPIDEDTYSTINGNPEEKKQMNEMAVGGSNANCNSVSFTVNQDGDKTTDFEGGVRRNSVLMKEEPRVVLSNMPSCAKSEASPATLPEVVVTEFQMVSAETASPSYATAVKYGVDKGGKESARCQNNPPVAAPSVSQTVSKLSTVVGIQGQKKHKFQPKGIDDKGRLHHGVLVLGAFKSKECDTHTNPNSQLHDIDRCTFAHSWQGDTRQFICTRCTQDEKKVCRQRKEHKQYIWDLGPYLNEDGKIWKESCS